MASISTPARAHLNHGLRDAQKVCVLTKVAIVKVALNPLRRIFFLTLQKVASYHADCNSIIKNGEREWL